MSVNLRTKLPGARSRAGYLHDSAFGTGAQGRVAGDNLVNQVSESVEPTTLAGCRYETWKSIGKPSLLRESGLKLPVILFRKRRMEHGHVQLSRSAKTLAVAYFPALANPGLATSMNHQMIAQHLVMMKPL